MPFNLNFPTIDKNKNDTILQLEPGQTLYILGANGTGKSSLLQYFKSRYPDSSRWISAHRQTWLQADTPNMTLATKSQAEKNIQSSEKSSQARYRDDYALQKTNIALQNLILSEYSRARAIAGKVDQGSLEEARTLSSKQPGPIDLINDIFHRSNLPIHFQIDRDQCLRARKRDGTEYGASEMSDGERNALLIATEVLTALPETLLLIDEPERHLHRSIAAPLLAHLFGQRKDCGFVVSTHDIDLPMGAPEAHVLLLWECSFEQNNVQRWAADKLELGAAINEEFKRDLLGARRQIFFVEGDENSLDKRLYSCIFPSVSVIPKGSCAEVRRVVAGFKSGEGLHWWKVYGIVDGDGVDDNKIIENRLGNDVYTLPYYSVEAVYFHPDMIERIAKMKADEFGSDESELYKDAIDAGIAAVDKNKDHLSQHRAKQLAKRKLMSQLPNDNVLLAGFSETICVGGVEIYQEVRDSLNSAVEKGSWEEILKICPIRKSGAKKAIAKALHFNDSKDYEGAVIQMLLKDEEARNFVRGLFGNLANSLADQNAQQGNAE